MKYLYKYPQAAYPYDDLVQTNRKRSRTDMEYELLDTGIFNENRYFDVFVEYAKVDAEDILIQISVCNRGPEAATLHVLPTLLVPQHLVMVAENASSRYEAACRRRRRTAVIAARTKNWARAILYCEGDLRLLFTENETNKQRIFGTRTIPAPYVKDAFHNYVVAGSTKPSTPSKSGPKPRRIIS